MVSYHKYDAQMKIEQYCKFQKAFFVMISYIMKCEQIFAVHILHILRCLSIIIKIYKISLKCGNNLN
jgi:hypothetical protein